MHKRTLARPAALLTATLLTGSVLVGCGSDDGSGSDGDHNDADVTFATQMIPHHSQAVEMAELVDGKDVDPEVADLAADIKAAQDPEIETMTGWLEEWGEDVPDSDSMGGGHGGGHDMGGSEGDEMPGMMTGDEMAALENADGEQFQTMWLEMMTEHHEGAVEMAQTEQEDGQYEPAIDLAKTIEETQTDEIATMKELLGDA